MTLIIKAVLFIMKILNQTLLSILNLHLRESHAFQQYFRFESSVPLWRIQCFTYVCQYVLKPQFTMTQIEYLTNLGFPHLVNKYTGFPGIANF